MASTITYLNTDLELRADVDLGDLVAALTQTPSDLYLLNTETLQFGLAVFELNGVTKTTATETIADMIAIIDALPEAAQTDWARCTSRTFDIGFRSGTTPHAIATNLPPALLLRIAGLDASISVTLYAIDPDDKVNDTSSSSGKLELP